MSWGSVSTARRSSSLELRWQDLCQMKTSSLPICDLRGGAKLSNTHTPWHHARAARLRHRCAAHSRRSTGLRAIISPARGDNDLSLLRARPSHHEKAIVQMSPSLPKFEPFGRPGWWEGAGADGGPRRLSRLGGAAIPLACRDGLGGRGMGVVLGQGRTAGTEVAKMRGCARMQTPI